MTRKEASAPNLDSAPILLPLLSPPSSAPNALSPPLHLLANGKVSPSRIVLTTSNTQWVSTNHVFPAAYPRSHPLSTAPPSEALPNPGPVPASKDEESRRRKVDTAEWDRRKGALSIQSHFPPETEEEAKRIAHEEAARAYPQLWSTVQRIVPVRSEEPKGDAQPYTLLLAHANGFHKETWEPMLPHLLRTLEQSNAGIAIDEIWSLDTIGSGESGTLNRESLGETVSWFDGARDVLQLIHNYLPVVQKTTTTTSVFGPRWPDTELRYCRASEVFPDKNKGRKIIAVGHSFSGAALSMLAGAQPDIFEALILVDPVMFHKDNFSSFAAIKYSNLDHPAATKAVTRRDVWSTRKEAAEYFLSRPFWKAWHRNAADLYARFAIRPVFPSISPWQSKQPDDINQAVAWTLAMSKWSETAFFATSALGAFGLAALQAGNFRGRAYHFVMTQSVQAEKDTEAITRAVERFGGKTEVLNGDHLVVQQQPELIGECFAHRWWHEYRVADTDLITCPHPLTGQRIANALVNLLGQASKPATPAARL